MKKCNVNGCNEDIQQWQVLCPKHYMEQMGQVNPATQEPPKMPQAKVTMPEQKHVPEKPKEMKAVVMPNMDEKQRLEIRMSCLRSAVELLVNTDIEQKTYDQLLEELKTLVEELFSVVVAK